MWVHPCGAAPLTPQPDELTDSDTTSNHPNSILARGQRRLDMEIAPTRASPASGLPATPNDAHTDSKVRFLPERARAQPDRGPMVYFSLAGIQASTIPTPLTAHAALTGPHRHEWQLSMQREMDSLRKFNAFEFASLPRGRKIINMKWVFRVKQRENGEVLKLKSRLTCKGFTQRPGIDYLEVYAPVASYTTIRMHVRWHGRVPKIRARSWGEI